MVLAPNYPTATTYGKTGYHDFADKVRGFIASAITNSSTSVDIDVSTAAKLDTVGVDENFILHVGNAEQIFIASRSGVTCTFASGGRAFGSPVTTQQDHSLGALFEIVAGATQMRRVTAELKALIDDLPSFVKKDGSIAMTGVLDLGTHRITGMSAATGASDGVSRAFGDTRYAPIAVDFRSDGSVPMTGDLLTSANLKWQSGTAFTGVLDHAITAARTWTLPDLAGTIPLLEMAQTFTAQQTMAGDLRFKGGTGFTNVITGTPTANRTYTVPDRSGQVVLQDIFNVMDYGATGDGTTDDTTAIAAALTAISSAGGGKLWFPAGTYRVTNLTYPNVQHTWSGVPRKSIIKRLAGGTTTYMVAPSTWISNSTSANAPIEVEGIDCDANAISDTAFILRSYFSRIQNCRFKGSNLHDFRVAIDSANGTLLSGTLVNNRYLDNWFGVDGTTAQSNFIVTPSNADAASDHMFEGNYVSGATVRNFYVSRMAGWQVRGNHFYGGVLVGFGGMATGSVVTDNYFENDVLVDGQIQNSQNHSRIGPGNYFSGFLRSLPPGVTGDVYVYSIGNRYSSSGGIKNEYFGSDRYVVSIGDTFMGTQPFQYVNSSSTGKFIVVGSIVAGASTPVTHAFQGPNASSATFPVRPTTWDGTFGFPNGGFRLQSNKAIQFGNTGQASLQYNSTTDLVELSGKNLSVLALTSPTVNGLTITASTGTLTLANAKVLTVSNTLTLTGTDGSSVAFGTGGTVAYVANKLSVFAATSSAELASVMSDETGSGALVFATSPTLVTPVLGVATVTTVNKVTITQPATGSTLTVANGKTLTANNTLTLAGTDGQTFTFPAASDTVAVLGTAQTFTKGQTVTPTTLTALALNVQSGSPVGSASVFTSKLNGAAGTITWITTPQTGAFASVLLDQDTLVNPSSGTIATAATLKIAGPPVASTNVTITTPLSLWVVTGTTRLDGSVALATTSTAQVYLGTTATNAQERLTIVSITSKGGTTGTLVGGWNTVTSTFNLNSGTMNGDLHYNAIGTLTITASSAQTVTNAAALKIAAAPVAGANVTITNSYPLWVVSGMSRFDGGIGFSTDVSFSRTAAKVIQLGAATNFASVAGTTGMTDGFYYIPAAAGAPSGTPTAVAGNVPLYYDTTNDFLYLYTGGAWKKSTVYA